MLPDADPMASWRVSFCAERVFVGVSRDRLCFSAAIKSATGAVRKPPAASPETPSSWPRSAAATRPGSGHGTRSDQICRSVLLQTRNALHYRQALDPGLDPDGGRLTSR